MTAYQVPICKNSAKGHAGYNHCHKRPAGPCIGNNDYPLALGYLRARPTL